MIKIFLTQFMFLVVLFFRLPIHKSFFFFQSAGWRKENYSIPPINTLDVDGVIPPAELLYSDCGEMSLQSEYTGEHCQLKSAALIERKFSNRLVVHKSIDRLTCVQLAYPYMDWNLASPCWTGQILIYVCIVIIYFFAICCLCNFLKQSKKSNIASL